MARETLDQRHEGSLRKRTTVTPLPKVQLFTLLYLLLAEPITSTVIRPFIVKVRTKELRVAKRAGSDITITVYWRNRHNWWCLQNRLLCWTCRAYHPRFYTSLLNHKSIVGIAVLPYGSSHDSSMGSSLRSHWSKTNSTHGFVGTLLIHAVLWSFTHVLGYCCKPCTCWCSER